jgi:farnesyl-diphosphate farnesyltransferase
MLWAQLFGQEDGGDVEPIDLTQAERRYLSNEMEKVSRSFALVVPTLEEPLNYYTATAYLICRVVDNIEDCTQPFVWKNRRFQEFHHLLDEPAIASEILARWGRERWPGLTLDEAAMMSEVAGRTLWQIYAKIPDGDRAVIRRWTAEMADGMALIEGPAQNSMLENHNGVLVLSDAAAYNDYCFYVAGTVGHMVTELAVRQYGLTDEISAQLLASCEACGRCLQKTNILKDFAKDLTRGISYIPYTWHQEIDCAPLALAGAPIEWIRKVIDDIVHELQQSTQYLCMLPYAASGYRMASLMSLLPAYQTVLLAGKQNSELFTPAHQVKISRTTMMKCRWDARSMLNNDEAIQRYSNRLNREIDRALAM